MGGEQNHWLLFTVVKVCIYFYIIYFQDRSIIPTA